MGDHTIRKTIALSIRIFHAQLSIFEFKVPDSILDNDAENEIKFSTIKSRKDFEM